MAMMIANPDATEGKATGRRAPARRPDTGADAVYGPYARARLVPARVSRSPSAGRSDTAADLSSASGRKRSHGGKRAATVAPRQRAPSARAPLKRPVMWWQCRVSQARLAQRASLATRRIAAPLPSAPRRVIPSNAGSRLPQSQASNRRSRETIATAPTAASQARTAGRDDAKRQRSLPDRSDLTRRQHRLISAIQGGRRQRLRKRRSRPCRRAMRATTSGARAPRSPAGHS